MSGNSYKRFYAVGSTTWDSVTGYNTKAIRGQKDPRAFEYEAVGGGGANFSLALDGLKKFFGGDFEIKLATKIGPRLSAEDHSHLDDFSRDRTNMAIRHARTELENVRLFDTMRGRTEFTFPRNTVTVWVGDRHIGVDEAFKLNAVPIFDGAEGDMRNDVLNNTDAAFIHSTTVVESGIAGHAALEVNQAGQKHIPVLLDYSAKNPSSGGNQDKLLEYATHVVAPVEAKLPNMDHSQDVINPDQLFRRLYEEYGIQHVAVSGGTDPIRVYEQGETLSISIKQYGKVKDTLGCGDTRNAALFYFMNYRDNDFPTALEKASAVASFAVLFKNRDWLKAKNPETGNLLFSEFIRSNSIFKDDVEFMVDNFLRSDEQPQVVHTPPAPASDFHG